MNPAASKPASPAPPAIQPHRELRRSGILASVLNKLGSMAGISAPRFLEFLERSVESGRSIEVAPRLASPVAVDIAVARIGFTISPSLLFSPNSSDLAVPGQVAVSDLPI
jgi:hypothetical protein